MTEPDKARLLTLGATIVDTVDAELGRLLCLLALDRATPADMAALYDRCAVCGRFGLGEAVREMAEERPCK